MNIEMTVEAGDWPDEPYLTELTRKATDAAVAIGGLIFEEHCELSVVFTNDAHIQALNRKWRSMDKPTNVLSFPTEEPAETGRVDGPLLGDIVLAFETCKCEAELEDKPFEHHLSHLLIHGFLHLFGYDHEIEHDAESMEELETAILSQMGIDDPYEGKQLQTDHAKYANEE